MKKIFAAMAVSVAVLSASGAMADFDLVAEAQKIQNKQDEMVAKVENAKTDAAKKYEDKKAAREAKAAEKNAKLEAKRAKQQQKFDEKKKALDTLLAK